MLFVMHLQKESPVLYQFEVMKRQDITKQERPRTVCMTKYHIIEKWADHVTGIHRLAFGLSVVHHILVLDHVIFLYIDLQLKSDFFCPKKDSFFHLIREWSCPCEVLKKK